MCIIYIYIYIYIHTYITYLDICRFACVDNPLLRSESGVAACSLSFLSPRLFFLLLGPIWSNSGLFFSESGQMDSERRRGDKAVGLYFYIYIYIYIVVFLR